MIGYRDMTFCPFYEDCRDKNDCHRPLTSAVKERAEHWWGKPDAPIVQFSDKPSCHRPIMIKQPRS